jgi:CTP:molybdopterin cytidylyltransferase MocA
MGKKNISVVILAGGNSERINFPKPFLLFSPRFTFMEKLISEYFKFGCRKIIVVVNSKFFKEDYFYKIAKVFSVIFVINNHPESGKFYSLKLGISKITSEKFCFIQNIDNPFTNLSLLNLLNKSKSDEGYTTPVFKRKGGHPILIGNTIIGDIKNEPSEDINLRIFLNKYQRIETPTKYEKITANINTLNDYKKYFYYKVKPLH